MKYKQPISRKKLADTKYKIVEFIDQLIEEHKLTALDVAFVLGEIIQRFMEIEMRAQEDREIQ